MATPESAHPRRQFLTVVSLGGSLVMGMHHPNAALTVLPQPVTLPAVGESIACAGAALFILCGKSGPTAAGRLVSVRARPVCRGASRQENE